MAVVLNIGQLNDEMCNVLVEWLGDYKPTWQPAGNIYYDAPVFLNEGGEKRVC